MEYDSNKAPKAKLKRMLIRIGIALAVVLLLTLIVYIAVNIFLDSIERIDPKQVYGSNDPVIAFEQDEPVEKTPVSAQAEELFVGKDIVNILLAGQDRRAWETEGPQRTDAMILCTVNMKDKTITITSFLCDLWVYIPDLYNQRLNMPYKLGGFPLLNETLEYNFGVRSDYNIEIDFSGFMKAIDAIGGVEIELTAAEAAYLNNKLDQANKERKKLEEKLEEINKEIFLYSQLKDTSLDVEQKRKILEKDYGEIDASYEMKEPIMRFSLVPDVLFDDYHHVITCIHGRITTSITMKKLVEVIEFQLSCCKS